MSTWSNGKLRFQANLLLHGQFYVSTAWYPCPLNTIGLFIKRVFFRRFDSSPC